ncbi:hypothetical protein CBM2608_U80003 [Cupriavidus taiwanensis]|nr:hypothetical protein CBM2608_U80003 [Cupriavidus taiwanensis]
MNAQAENQAQRLAENSTNFVDYSHAQRIHVPI